MPALTKEDREALLGPVAGACPRCDAVRIRHYCRSCDQFFLACFCSDDPSEIQHKDHRVYLWTPQGVLAIPDYDNL